MTPWRDNEPHMDEPEKLDGPDLRLSETEATVLRELSRRERDAAFPRLSHAYRRLLELSRGDDPIDAVLVAHLAREVLSAAPGALGVELVRGRLEYENRVRELSQSWPSESRSGEPPAGTVQELRRLLEDDDDATGRAREGARALFAQEDRAQAGFVPDPSIDRWIDLSKRGSGLAHRIRNLDRDLPAVVEARRLVDELSATLLATIAPFFASIGEIDRVLAFEAPDEGDARHVADLLRTASQYAYFFERASASWLRPLASIRRFLTSSAELVDVGGGYVRAPDWPQGRYLARVALSDPALIVTLVMQVPATTNPRVVSAMVAIARALPSDHATGLTQRIGERMSIPLAIEYAGIDAAALARDLAQAGHATGAARLLMSIVDAAIASRREDEWHLEQVLAGPLDAIAVAGGNLGPLRRRLHRSIGRKGPARDYSTIWLRRVDRRPQFRPDEAWLLANGLYRALLREPLGPGRTLTRELLATGETVFRRIALAAIAQRPELAETSDGFLSDAARSDDPSGTRFEFRRALGVLWAAASEPAKEALLRYAEAATEADEISERLSEGDFPGAPGPEAVRRDWRSRLLFEVREVIPNEWKDRLGPLDPVEDEGPSEPTADWVGAASPVTEDDLGAMGPDAVLVFLRDWTPTVSWSFDDPSLEGLANAASAMIVERVGEFAALGVRISRLRAQLVAAITSAIERGLRENRIRDRESALRLILDIGEAFPIVNGADLWARQVARDIAGTIARAASEEFLTELDGPRALALVRVLLQHSDPTPESQVQDVAGGYDVGMLALNSVRGQATTAAIELLLEARRRARLDLLAKTSAALRTVVASDFSPSVRAAIGLRLPWLLGRDAEHQEEWLRLLFGPGVPEVAKKSTWDAYLLYARFFADTAQLLAGQYGAAVVGLSARPTEESGRPRDADEQLGAHVAMAHLNALPVEADGRWLAQFYERAADWLRARTTRWIAEQVAAEGSPPKIRARARAFVIGRVEQANASVDAHELKAMGWVAGATQDEGEILERILLPALERSGGAIENEPRVAGLIARCSSDMPIAAAKALRLLIEGDPWQSLPHIAAAEIRQALEALMGLDIDDARGIAEDVIHTLGAHGFREYRDLLGDGPI